ncbi:ABC transporter permease [Aquicella lusitana]|uniref:NitT/TauT family transport system permease protein n=1 Tax=Aquicella lusitana TaxID=254246 RepID=A0A370GF65_9COXI|nr:ABC transporter permease subunit [Aquicella lusitana]RDI42452.1 NitT/TauT family transport system permease protein [Aquicella lusitana]VVC74086.1 Glycine betaine/carnitine transport permease protein GbuB [Aquicella lusitana]
MSFLRNTFMTAYRARLYPNYWDIIALLLVLAIITLFGWNAKQMATPYQLGEAIPITLHPSALPLYAARTVVRMLIALFFSLLFTFIFGTWAAKSPRAERIIIPTIDVLQSVPILGFLSVTVAGFIALFPGSMLGPECAAIFAIFTSQAWNMAFGFYQTVRSVPSEVEEAAKMLHLSAWQRFWRIEVPYSMPGLLWNTMASMSAGWFFVVAAEAITVSNQEILLPGIGSYIAVAIQAANMRAVAYAVITMFVVILVYDQLLFRPLVAWAEKFKPESQAAEKMAESWVINLFRRTRMIRDLGLQMARLFDAFVNVRLLRIPYSIPAEEIEKTVSDRVISLLWDAIIFILGAGAVVFLGYYMWQNLALSEIGHVFLLGLVTALRVFILIILCSLIWVPVGVWIGLRPGVAQLAQPIAQILAAFPANLFYPFIVMFIVNYHLSPNIWLTPLMILGAQWYILFNVIAGASMLPKDLLQVVDNLSVGGWLRWSRLLLPGIFPYYITGAITAAGGAWNASIVAEVASWGQEKLAATGLGAYITEYTTVGNFSRTALGIGMMCLLVLVFNRLIWRPLYVYAENRFTLE